MNRYDIDETLGRRAALGTAAIATSALAICLLLVIPATMTPESRDVRSAAAPQAASASVEADRRLHVEVIAVRERRVAAAQSRSIQAKRGQPG
jgi:hypothetical protein